MMKMQNSKIKGVSVISVCVSKKLTLLTDTVTAILNSRRGGFTLVELIIVVAIIGIIAAIAIPAYVGYIRSSKTMEAKNNLQSLQLLLSQYYSENSKYCPASNCANQSYSYTENDDGSVATNTIYLAGFKPKAATASTATLYGYYIQLVDNTRYTSTAAPVTARGGWYTFSINQDGVKIRYKDGSAGGW
jgi:prepilin-type N-terminal cleavage/methylation domain-containing protein